MNEIPPIKITDIPPDVLRLMMTDLENQGELCNLIDLQLAKNYYNLNIV